MQKEFRIWVRFSLGNLALVACLGVLMRYKIGFEFPFFEQKNIQHAHSNFAFTGWISHSLFTFICYSYWQEFSTEVQRRFIKLINANLIFAFGLLISFFVQGYGYFSISFTILSILTAILFAATFFSVVKDLAPNASTKWIQAGLVFNLVSSVGTFFIIYMMLTKTLKQEIYLACEYLYLHFQYNGWFFFACVGLFIGFLSKNGLVLGDKMVYKGMVFACVPAFFLSALWMKLPGWIYWLTVLATMIQFLSWLKFLQLIYLNLDKFRLKFSKYLNLFFILAGMAVSIKLMLQLGSTIPEISKLAFGFRPIVIAYLHLVLLGAITIFLIAYGYSIRIIPETKLSHAGLLIFVSGVLLNELVLMVQGIASFSYFAVPYVNQVLFIVALIILSGLIMVLISKFKNKKVNSK